MVDQPLEPTPEEEIILEESKDETPMKQKPTVLSIEETPEDKR